MHIAKALSDTLAAKLPKIVILGVGGGGCNAVNTMIGQIKDVTFAVANTDFQALSKSPCENKLQLGLNVTRGLGAGSNPEIGERAAKESIPDLERLLDGVNMLFITSGMGGGTGTGAAPVIAKVAKDMGILTVGVVTKPFDYEMKNRMNLAQEGIAQLQNFVDTLIVIPNQNLYRIANENTTFNEAYKMVDAVLLSGVRCITGLITDPGLVNLDFADVEAVIAKGGKSVMGEGEASGPERALKAAEQAISNPLLEYSSVQGAQGLLINVSGGRDMTLFEVSNAIDRISSEVDPGALMKYGSVIDPSLDNKIRISVVATGVFVEDDAESDTFEDSATEENYSVNDVSPESLYGNTNNFDDDDTVEESIDDKVTHMDFSTKKTSGFAISKLFKKKSK